MPEAKNDTRDPDQFQTCLAFKNVCDDDSRMLVEGLHERVGGSNFDGSLDGCQHLPRQRDLESGSVSHKHTVDQYFTESEYQLKSLF
jgi:hypothetical protein